MNSFLKKATNYVKVKVFNPIDGKLWRFATDSFERYRMYHRFDGYLINKFYPHIDTGALDPANPKDNYLMEHFTAYIYKMEEPMLVEPLYGWVIPEAFRVFRKSFSYIDDPWDNAKRKPSALQYIAPHKTIELDSCISIRYNWSNYYHFLIDTLNQVHLAEGKVPAHVPLLVPYFFPQLKHVADFMKESDFLKGRKIIVQRKNEYYKVKNLYICKDTFYSDSIFSVVRSFGDVVNKGNGQNRKIFLKRAKKRGRNIENIEEIERLVQQYGFEVIDTDDLDIKRQVALFAEAAMVIGGHGAGLTNIVFRNRRPLKLLELFPANKTPEHYRNLCLNFNYGYYSLICGNMERNQYYVDPAALQDKLIEFLN